MTTTTETLYPHFPNPVREAVTGSAVAFADTLADWAWSSLRWSVVDGQPRGDWADTGRITAEITGPAVAHQFVRSGVGDQWGCRPSTRDFDEAAVRLRALVVREHERAEVARSAEADRRAAELESGLGADARAAERERLRAIADQAAARLAELDGTSSEEPPARRRGWRNR